VVRGVHTIRFTWFTWFTWFTCITVGGISVGFVCKYGVGRCGNGNSRTHPNTHYTSALTHGLC
jgi:hypothetical protein